VRAGEHRIVARTPSGDEVEATATVPGPSVDLEVGTTSSRRSRSGR
jgi:hypothetical protein